MSDVRRITTADLTTLNALNDLEAEAVNALSPMAFGALAAQAFFSGCIGTPPVAFLMALSDATPAQGPNHEWFLRRYPRFAYVDRIVVAPSSRGQGLGQQLYAALEAFARTHQVPMLCCEVNLVPPNPLSLQFHEGLGFTAVGEAVDPRNGKHVRYLVKPLP